MCLFLGKSKPLRERSIKEIIKDNHSRLISTRSSGRWGTTAWFLVRHERPETSLLQGLQVTSVVVKRRNFKIHRTIERMVRHQKALLTVTRRSIYRLRLYWLFFCCSECTLIALWVLFECSLSALWVLSECSLSALWVLSDCSLSALWLFSDCSLTADLFLTDCLKIWARMMNIDYSRQTWTARMNELTEISTSWAPIGAKKFLEQLIKTFTVADYLRSSSWEFIYDREMILWITIKTEIVHNSW